MSKIAASDPTRLIGYVRGFVDRPVAVLGDLVVDEFVYGDIARVSREAPVLILDHHRTELVPGGGANSVANLRSLGADPLPVGVVGDDDPGQRLVARLRRIGVDTSGILIARRYATPCKSRILAGGVHTRRQQIVRVDRGSSRGELPATLRRRLRGALGRALRRSEGLLVADYGYGSASPQLLDQLVQRLDKRGVPITVDSRARVGRFAGVTACTPNEEELEQALSAAPLGENRVEAAGRRLLRRSRNRAVLLTRGAQGMLLFERGRSEPLSIPAYGSGEVADVTGAGDTVIAVFTLALLAGADFADAARLANYAAGLVVFKAGTATIARAELIRAVRSDLRSAPDAGGRK